MVSAQSFALGVATAAGLYSLCQLRRSTVAPSRKSKLLVCFGASLDVRGVSPESQAKFGKLGFRDYVRLVRDWACQLGMEVEFFPSPADAARCNDLDAFCAAIAAAPARDCDAVLLNPGGFSKDGAAGEQIGEALRTSGLPSVDMHYTSNVISRACSCRDKTQAFIVGAKQFSMKLAMIALQHMVEDPEWHAHDA